MYLRFNYYPFKDKIANNLIRNSDINIWASSISYC
jgi:hypothetical protein